MNLYQEILPIGSCLVLSFVLSGLESATLASSRVRLRHAAKGGNRRARAVEEIIGGHREHLLAALLLVNATVNLIAFALIANATVNALEFWGYLVAFIVSLPVYLIWVELLPKSLGRRFPNRTLVALLPVLRMIRYTILPLISALAIPARWILVRIFGAPPAPPGTTREEFRALTEVFEREGTLDSNETLMIRSVLDFQRVKVGQVMIPLSQVTAVPREMPLSAVLALARQTEFDQFPIIGPDGDLVGLVDVLELLRERVTTGTIEPYRRKLVQTRPDESAIAAVKRLRQAGHQLAAVCNSKGRPVGVVSVEDMIGKMVRAG
jgi:CBS domain containing-hemolysin-like protein